MALLLAACGGGGGGSTGGTAGTPPPGPPTLGIGNATVAEGDAGTTTMTFTVTLSAASTSAVSVDYATADDTATAGWDYTATAGTLTFPAGTTSRSITVSVQGDILVEPDETFHVVLSNAVGATIATGTGTGTILNDDLLPALSIADAAVSEWDSGAHALVFTVTLSPAATGTVTVHYATANGSATAGSDYVATSGTLTFPPGTTTRTIDVDVLGDTDPEPNESFAVVLSNPAGAVLARAQALGTITNDDGVAQFGLDARPANAACVAPPRPTSGAGVETRPFSDFSFTQPTKILQAPGDAAHWYVLEKGGRVKRFDTANPATSVTTFLDLSARVDARGEGGLLGMAFHPNYPATQEAFVSYTAPGTGGYEMVSRIARLKLDGSSNPPEEILLTLNQPLIYHKGGDIAFGPDGYLYVGFGDGATPLANRDAQNLQKLLGKVLRIGVVGVAFPSPGYTIPADNPYAANARCGAGGTGAAACPEIYAYGFRNPWRWSIDPVSGRLWLGDVGETHYEEVDIVRKGGNYGWPEREGLHCTPELYPGGTGCATSGNGDPMIDPVAEYAHGDGNIAITGGFVYHGTAIPELQGKYVFADFNKGSLWTLADNGDGSFTRAFIFNEGHLITAFGTGLDGELYFADYGGGQTSAGIVRKIVLKTGVGTPDTIWTNLADSPCVDASDPSRPGPGMIPFGVNSLLWSDGAAKERWLAIPDGTTIDVNAANDWNLPPGSVLMKLFRLNGNPIETRMLMRHPDGEWRGYTWAWSNGVATRLKDGLTTTVEGQSWRYPSEAECLRCHTAAAGYSLGPETAQLNGNFHYAATGRTANQVATLDHIGLFTAPIGDPAALPALPDPADASQSLGARARSWLHTNCSGCHRPGGPTPAAMDLRYGTPLAQTGACNAAPGSGDLGLSNPKLIKPGDAANSLVRERMNRRDAWGMPPLGTAVPDAAAVALVTDWINGLSGCN